MICYQKVAVTLILILIPFTIIAQRTFQDSLFLRANSLYEQNHYTEAVNLYNQILNQGYEHINLYYNLGNAYYQLGHLGDAIWAYEKGLKMNPRDGDLRFNLQVANVRTVDRVEVPEPFFLVKWYGALKRGFSPAQWLLAISLAFLVSGMLYVFYKLFLGKIRFFVRNLVFIGLTVTIFSGLVFADLYFELLDKEEGIVTALEGKVYSAPTDISNLLFVIHQGTKATISTKQYLWFEIELIDGKKGWIQSEQIRTL